MIAVVDLHPEHGVKKRAASPSRLLGRLMQRDPDSALGQIYCCGEPGQAAADNVNDTRFHKTNPRTRIQINRLRRNLMGARGASQPRATNCDRIR